MEIRIKIALPLLITLFILSGIFGYVIGASQGTAHIAELERYIDRAKNEISRIRELNRELEEQQRATDRIVERERRLTIRINEIARIGEEYIRELESGNGEITELIDVAIRIVDELIELNNERTDQVGYNRDRDRGPGWMFGSDVFLVSKIRKHF